MAESARQTVERNPFPGLRPFRPDEEHLFFGREDQVDRMVDKLAVRHFLAVVGTSGSGKSSLVNCGLRPALHRGYMASAGSAWRMVQFRPGDDPIGAMAQALASPGNLFSAAAPSGMPLGQLVEATLRLGSLGLVDIVEQARLAPGENLLLVVDQFEELFRFHGLSSQAATHAYGPAGDSVAFVRMLLEAAAQRAQPIYVVLTMRSDFLGECAQFQGLPEAINEGQYLVPRLTRDEIRAAIAGPVNVAHASISPVLLTRLLNDVGDNPDQLSILQHALNRTWANWEHEGGARGALDLAHYEAIGGMQRALDRHAEKAYAELNAQQQQICERVFKALTDKGSDPRGIRRPMRLANLCAVTGANQDDLVAVINHFRKASRSFLMPPLGEPLTPESVIDISHESFMRVWDRLAKWANEEAESRAMLLRLSEAVRLHAEERGGLWRDPELKQALKWREQTKPTWPWAGLLTNTDGAGAWESVTGFLDSSVSALESSAKESRRVQARKKLWMGVASALAVILAGLFVRVMYDASARSKNIAAELTNRALLDVDLDPARSAHLALAALRQDSANVDAESALRRALANLEVAHAEATLSLKHPVRDVRYSRDGTRLVIASGKTATVIDDLTFEHDGQKFERDHEIWKAWLIADNTTLITFTWGDGGAQMQRIGDSTVRQLSCPGEGNAVWTVAVGPSERYVGVGCLDGEIRIWDVAYPEHAPQELGRSEHITATALAFSADDKYLASGDAAGNVELWSLGQSAVSLGRIAEPDQTGDIGDRAVGDISFHPSDSTLLVTAGDDHRANVWRLVPGAQLVANKAGPTTWPMEHDRPVSRAFLVERPESFQNDNPVVTISDKVVRLWTDEHFDPKQVRGHDDWISNADISRDGERLVTSSLDGTVRIWSTRSGEPLAVLRGHVNVVNQAVFSPDGQQVATAGEDGTVRVWRTRLPRILLSAEHWILSATFEPGGTRIAVGEEGPASILDASGDGIAKREALEAYSQKDMIAGMSWSRDRKLLVGSRSPYYITRRKSVALWDVQSRAEITPDWLKDYRAATFASGTDELLTINSRGKLAIWKSTGLASGDEAVPEVKDFGENCYLAAISPDGAWIAAVTYAGTTVVRLWKRSALEDDARLLEGHNGDIMSLQFSSDSQQLVTASRDHTATIWSTESAVPLVTLADSQSTELISAAFDPSGTRVATGAADGAIRVWDAARGKVVAVFRWDDESVNNVEFSADGKSILSASDNGKVMIARCDACAAPVADLPGRVDELTNLSDPQREAITREIDQVRARGKLSSFMAWLSPK